MRQKSIYAILSVKFQGGEIEGDALTVYLKAKDPYSVEGIPMKDRILIEEGTLKALQGGQQICLVSGD